MSSPTTVVSTRLDDLAKGLYSIVQTVGTDGDAIKEAQEALNEAADVRTQGRFGILLKLANFSLSNNITAGEIKTIATHATKLSNNLESQKAIATFMSDCKVAMTPGVREIAPLLRDMVGQLWVAEGDQPKDQTRPCRKAFKREYHMFKSAMVAVSDDKTGTVLRSKGDLLGWAEEMDPEINAKKVAGELEQMAERLGAMRARFPVDSFNSIVEFLTEINEDVLKAARQQLLNDQEDRLQAHTVAPVPPATIITPIIVATVVEDEPEVVASWEQSVDELLSA